MTPVIDITGLEVTYADGTRALRGIDLQLQAGEKLGIVGESGCGKSTLVLALLGLLGPSASVSGSVLVAGIDPLGRDRGALRRLRGGRVGYVAQDPFSAFTPVLPVGWSLREAWTAQGRRVDDAEMIRRLADLGIAQAADRLRRRPGGWSGGMLQRAAIVAALANTPAVVVADEPTSALDAELADAVLAELHARAGALLLVSHDLRLVARHTGRIAVLYAGRVVETGDSHTVLGAPRHPYTRRLLAATPDGTTMPQPVPGAPPRIAGSISGCAFAPRCDRRRPCCVTDDPRLVQGLACPVTA